MTKALPITHNNKDVFIKESGWDEAVLEDVMPKVAYVYLQDVQLPYGHVDHCIVTVKTYESLFVTPLSALLEERATSVVPNTEGK